MRRNVCYGLVLLLVLISVAGPALAQGGETIYTVQQGDTLFRIALRFNVNLATLAAINGIADPSRIYVGQVLVIPTGGAVVPAPTTTTTMTTTTTTTTTTATTTTGAQTHVVQPGENLFRISLRYGVSLAALAAANGIVDPSRIYAGQVLVIPAGGTPGAVVVPAPTTPGSPSVPAPVVAPVTSGTTAFYLNGQASGPGRLPRPNNETDQGTFEAKREAFRQYTAVSQTNLAALTVSDIRYGPYWATMSINLRNIGVSPAIAGGRTYAGSSTPIGLVDPVPGSGGVPVPRVSGPWGFNVRLNDGRVVTAYAGCRHVASGQFDCGSGYQVNPASDLVPGASAGSELVVYFADPFAVADPNKLGTGFYIVSMDLFAFLPDGRQTGTLLQIAMP